MNPTAFIAKWRHISLTERAAAQQHFLDLCALVNHPTPAALDPTGDTFTFERGAAKHGGGDGWADVWKRGFFAFEYKGKHKNLEAAYDQLLKYRESLENPPLLVVCDLDRILIHTNFTATTKTLHSIPLEELAQPRNLEILRHLFHEPERLKPGTTSVAITQDAAGRLARLAESLRQRDVPPADAAHFLVRIVFCLFAEDIGLLPDRIFTNVVEKTRAQPALFRDYLAQLFQAMATGGHFLLEPIRHFNGNLFSGDDVIALTAAEIESIHLASRLDWSAVDPSILGTLFERGLDPAKRTQLGAHYTSREDIETLVEPVVMTPLRREWQETKAIAASLLATGKKTAVSSDSGKNLTGPALKKARAEAERILQRYQEKLSHITVLDPACGSGNFLYVTLQKLKDLEKEIIVHSMDLGFSGQLPMVGPWQLYGLELSPYAYDLAQMTVWVGFLQWTRANGFAVSQNPVLRTMSNFQNRDAILDLSDPAHPLEAVWPQVDFIVGNPPFLGDKIMRSQLGDAYVSALRKFYEGRVPGGADLCCYWFERARTQIKGEKCRRAGLIATQGIRGGANREVLKRIQETGGIFFAISDQEWVLDGANVHVSMVAFDDGTEKERTLDGVKVETIHPNLTATDNLGTAKFLNANKMIGFVGVAQKAPFDLPEAEALKMLHEPNPNGKPSSDVLRPICNAMDITRRNRNVWNIDFGLDRPEADSSLFEKPFAHVVNIVRPLRIGHREPRQVKYWWLFARPCPDMRNGLEGLPRFLATPRVSKHRIFAWLTPETLCDSAAVAFARDDDYFFGILHSRIHELWALAQGTQLREKESGFRYTPTTCFETFPFPTPTADQTAAIAAAAKTLDTLRTRWLNPPEWTQTETLIFPGSATGPWSRYLHDIDAATGLGTVQYPRLVPHGGDCAVKLAKRTLTALYNERPSWLAHAHAELDAAVSAAYGFPADLPNQEILSRLLSLNQQLV